MTGMDGLEVQVYFLFERAAAWPPVPSEGLLARPQGDGLFEILETPFFVRNVALSDVVTAVDDGSGVLWAGERVRWGGHQTLRVTPRDDLGASLAGVADEFAELGLSGEELEEYQLLALDVPPGTPTRPVKDLLVTGHASGRWWYEESCIAADWPAQSDPAATADASS